MNALHQTPLNSTVFSQKNLLALLKPVLHFERFLGMIATLFVTWFDRISDRRQLIRYNDRILEDIGMTRWEALQEYHKPFWKK